jgi:hypothetical protein
MDDIDLGAAMDPQAASFAPEIVEALPSPSGFDLSPIALSLVPYERHVALMVAEARDIIVRDTESDKTALDAEGRNKKRWQELERARKNFVAPLNDHLKRINNLFHALQDPLLSNEALIKKERGKWALQEDLKRRDREAAEREERRRLQAKLEAEAQAQRLEADRKAREAAEKLKSEEDEATRAALEQEIAEETAAANAPTPQVAPIVSEKPEVVRTAHGSSYTKFKWVCEIIEPDLVPRTYCEPFQKHLDDAVKGGVRNIPGCVIQEVAIPVTRV